MLPLTKVFNSNPAWYRGDFHLHTTFSDGHYSPHTLARLAAAEGLNFFAITDHNSIGSFGKFCDETGVLVMPGIEVSLAEGHWNIYGIEGQPDWLAEFCVWDRSLRIKDLSLSISDFMKKIAESGMLNSINHPLLKPWEWQDGTAQLEYIHCLEVWNDPFWPDNDDSNPAAIKMWTRWLNAGYRITAIGGSNFHFMPGELSGYPGEIPGYPSTFVYAEELSSVAIMDSLRRGRAYISIGPQLNLQVECGGHRGTIGSDFGQVCGSLKFYISINGAEDGSTARLIKNGSEIVIIPIVEDQSVNEFDVLLDGSPCWYRFDVFDKDGRMLAVTNPVYCGPPIEHNHKTFSNLIPADKRSNFQ
jgi:hypothetical protein